MLTGLRGCLDSNTRAVKWLVVFDNVDHKSTLQHFWPAGAHGSVLVTTRDASVARHFGQQALEVPLFTRSESMHFMFEIHPTTERTSPTEIEAVKCIAERSDNLPLILGSIGGYTSSISSSYQVFLQHYSDFDRNLIFQQGTSDTSSYEASISTTWTMALSRIDPSAKDLMETIAFFDPDSIPINLLENRNIDDKCVIDSPVCGHRLKLGLECIMDRMMTSQSWMSAWRQSSQPDNRKMFRGTTQ